MMSAQKISIDQLSGAEIVAWLQSALEGKQTLPYAMPGESHHLAIMRLQQAQRSDTRNLLVEACIKLLRQFCAQPSGASDYLEELIFLAAMQKNDTCIALLQRLAKNFAQAADLPLPIRHSILGILADASPPQSIEFWEEILQQEPVEYAGMALAGELASKPMQALHILAKMPNQTENGEFGAINLDLTWDALAVSQRGEFVEAVAQALSQCGREFAAPVWEWLATKSIKSAVQGNSFALLLAAIKTTKPDGFVARRTTPKICRELQAA